MQFRVVPQRPFEQLQVAHDDTQQIIEIMRNAAGQLTHRFHLLCLYQFFLECFVFRDILGHRKEALDFAVSRYMRQIVDLEFSRFAVALRFNLEFDLLA